MANHTKKEHVNDATFLEALYSSKSVSEVAEKLNLTAGNCYQRIQRLRDNGVPTPEFESSGKGKDYDALQALAAQFAEQNGVTKVSTEVTKRSKSEEAETEAA